DAVPDEVRATWQVRLHVARGPLADEIVTYAADLGAAMIVVGAQRKVDQILASADCPVLAVGRPRDALALAPQCLDCVDVRHWSKGERWFCTHHHDARPGLTASFA